MVLKKVLKFIIKSLIILFIFVCIYLTSSFILSRITIDKENNIKEELSIYILTNGVHTDIVVPAKNEQYDWTKEIKYFNTKSKDSTNQYLAMGWGDKGFYLETPTWAELKTSVAFKAATGLGSTAIHTTYYAKMIEGDDCKKINISREQYKRLIKYISNSFKKI